MRVAAAEGRTELVAALVAASAHVESREPADSNPKFAHTSALDRAALNGQTAMVTELVRLGAKINSMSSVIPRKRVASSDARAVAENVHV
jgi:hypothetical protein